MDYYRGGNSLTPRPQDVRIDPATGLIMTTHGVSVFDRPDGLERFGGAYRVTAIPVTLKIIQRGRNLHHFEIVPIVPMTVDDYDQALMQIVLISV